MDSMQTGKQEVKKKTGSALQGSSPCLSTLRKAIRSLGAGHRFVASRNDGEKLIFVEIGRKCETTYPFGSEYHF